MSKDRDKLVTYQKAAARYGEAFDRMGEAFLDFTKTEIPDVTKQLIELRDQLKEEGDIPSRPLICAAYIGEIVMEHVQGSASGSKLHPVEQCIVSGFAFGLGIIPSAIYVGQREIEGKAMEDYQEMRRTQGEQIFRALGVNSNTDVEIKAFLGGMRINQQASEKLIEDPSGFALVNWAQEQYQTEEQKRFFAVLFIFPEIPIKGLTIAAKLYKALYPLTESLPQPKPHK